MNSDMKRASTASRRPLPPNPEVRYSTRPLPPPMPSSNSSYMSTSSVASIPLPSPSPYPMAYPGAPSFPGFSLPNPVYGSPVGSNGLMYPTGSLPPHPPPFVPPGGFLPGYLPPPGFPVMPPGYPSGPPPNAGFQQEEKGRTFEDISGQRRDEDGDGGQATPRPTDRKDQQDYFVPSPKSSTRRPSDGQSRQGKSFGQEYLASLSVSDEPEEYSPSIVDSYQRQGQGQGSEAHLISSGSIVSGSGQSGDDTSSPGVHSQEQSDLGYLYGGGAGVVGQRESVVSLPQSVRTFGEGPSNQNGSHHRRTYSRDPQLQSRGSLAPSWLEQNQDRPPARWVQNKLFLHQSHAAGFSPNSMGEVTGEGGEEEGYFDEEYEEEYDEEEAEEQNEMNFFSPSLLSHVSVQLRDRVERNSHIKGGIPWPKSFTGRDVIVSMVVQLVFSL